MSSTKLTTEDIDTIFTESFNLQTLNGILDNDLSDVVDYVREKIGTKSAQKVTKSTKKVTRLIGLVDLLKDEKSRHEILSFLELDNQTKNFTTNIKPLIENGIIELTTPDKPNSRLQKYRLTEKGRKLIK